LLAAISWSDTVPAQQIPQNVSMNVGAPGSAVDLQLEVTVNGRPTGLIAAFRQEGGRLTIEAVQLENCGIKAAGEARLASNRVDIGKLPGVSFLYEEKLQAISFTAMPNALAVHRIDSRSPSSGERLKPQSSTGALVNYTLYGASGGESIKDLWEFQGLSGAFDMRVFGSLGLFSSSQVITLLPNDLYSTARLDTAWSYSDPDRMLSYQIGDVISGGLSWTRPVRLGGAQIRRNFGLRSDLVTMPLPEVSGTAAVPSTVDLYVNNTRRSSHDVPAGPFSISDIPAISGDATARLVVRDALGRETVTETPLFASADLLAPGLFDYSAEIGFARRNYGLDSFNYDERPFGMASSRYGLTNQLTLEGHAEAGLDFLNGGIGAVFALGTFGIGTAAIAGSRYGDESGLLASLGAETEIFGMNLRVNSQRTFGDYNDIASITATRNASVRAARSSPAKALDQVNLSVPINFDDTVLNFSFTNVTSATNETSRIFGVTASRAIGERGNLLVTAYTDVARSDSYGVFAGFTWSFVNDMTASTGVSRERDGYAITSDLVGTTKRFGGNLDWRVRDVEGNHSRRAAAAAYRNGAGRVEGRIEQSDRSVSVRGQVDGSLIVAGGDVFIADRIEDSFAIVDAGAPDVAVEFENRPAGKTNRRGRLLVPNLRSYEDNSLSIDPAGLPLETSLESTRETVMPHRGSGVLVRFGAKQQTNATLITLLTPDGEPVESGSLISVEGSDSSFVVGYDGQAYLTGLTGKATLTVQQPTAGTCEAVVDFGTATTIPNALCRRIE